MDIALTLIILVLLIARKTDGNHNSNYNRRQVYKPSILPQGEFCLSALGAISWRAQAVRRWKGSNTASQKRSGFCFHDLTQELETRPQSAVIFKPLQVLKEAAISMNTDSDNSCLTTIRRDTTLPESAAPQASHFLPLLSFPNFPCRQVWRLGDVGSCICEKDPELKERER